MTDDFSYSKRLKSSKDDWISVWVQTVKSEMATIEELKTQISSAQDLQSVVKTMKALAAVSIRQ